MSCQDWRYIGRDDFSRGKAGGSRSGNITMLERGVLAKSVVKKAGKLQVNNDMLKAQDTMCLL
jgi:hypothetical protein